MAKRRASARAENIASGPAETGTSTVPVRFGFEAPGLENAAARELFDKIMGALGLAAEDFAAHVELPAAFSASVVVRFVAASDAKDAGAWDGNRLTTYSLAAMLAEPGLKKPVWAHVREAIARGTKS
ncbi:MAG: hypothetical protein JST04_06035 [Bdellovibrionales bacterium]|nr:hypothetical protein [Bdellovibrionales bacterium]